MLKGINQLKYWNKSDILFLFCIPRTYSIIYRWQVIHSWILRNMPSSMGDITQYIKYNVKFWFDYYFY